jgi:threonine dehydratase
MLHPASLTAIEAAAKTLRPMVVHTPLVPLRGVPGADGIFIKPEIHQVVGSFKIRGVLHWAMSLEEQRRRSGLSTVSAGNTAQALAWAGRHLGVPARSLMPETAPRTKIEAVERLGGTAKLVPMAELFRFMQERLWEQEPYAYIDPWREPLLHVGHGTLGLEIMEDLPAVGTVYVPVGGGGLIAGVASAVKARSPRTRIVAVEPAALASLHESLRTGKASKVEGKTICDGVAVPFVTDEMFPLLQELVDDTALVSEEDVLRGVRLLALENKIVSETSGALAVIAAVARRDQDPQPSVAIVTGGSIDTPRLLEILGC